jgi:prepilin signal peptidase PulO-like enzyme (type II secretory pathway)
MFYYAWIFLFGLIVGSFLNAVIYRLDSGESIVKSRSHCPKCGHVLAWYELVPIFSFVIQGGKCRECKSNISWQYPLVELATAILFVLVLYHNLPLLYTLTISSLLIVIFVYDLKHYIIPDKIIYPAILVSGIFVWQHTTYNIQYTIYAAIGASVFFAAMFFASRGKWMGFGDVKLAFFMGLFLGWPDILVGLFAAFMLGGIIGMGLIAYGKKTMKSQVPFGPFLVTGTFIAMFLGDKITEWYLSLFI